VTTYGLTDTGFVRKPESVSKAEILADMRTRIHPGLSDSPDTVSGQLIGIMASRESQSWERDEANYNAFSPNATGNALDRTCEITGTRRDGPKYSHVECTVNVDPGTYAAGDIAAKVAGDPNARFVSDEAVTNGGGAAADFTVAMVADTAGPVRAPAGQLYVLDAPPAGVNSITNVGDADLGSETEEDADLRVRREQELEGSGSGTDDALRADVRKVDGTTDVSVVSNRTNATDGAGRPAKCVEVSVLGGDDDDIAQAIWANLTQGIEAYSASSDSGTAIDDESNEQVIGFTRPSARRLYARVTLVRDPVTYAGDATVKTTVSDFTSGTLTILASNGNEISGAVKIGGTVYRSKVSAAVQSVPGIIGITSVEFSTDGATWVNADHALAVREYLGTSSTSKGIQTADVTLVVS
jgi:uncharacterized phage protein gp47/JayE